MNITIRDVNPRFWRELKIEAVRKGLTIGQAVNLALDNLLHKEERHVKKSEKSFWNVKPASPTSEDAKNFSTMVDEALYG